MSLTSPSAGNIKTKFLRKFFAEHVREDWFARFFGTDETSIIQTKEDLVTESGKTMSIPIITRLKGGVRGNETLEGNEEELGNANHDLAVYTVRNAVKVTKNDQQTTEIQFLRAARPRLKDWIMSLDRDEMITAMMSMGADKAILASQVLDESNYSTLADETQKDSYLADNSDRFLFGAAKSNNSSNDHSASLANIDNTTDKLDLAMVSLAKRMAQLADPHIRPWRSKTGEEWFVLFVNSLAMRDFRADTAVINALREGWARQVDDKFTAENGNPLFRGGDILIDGIIVTEMPELPVLTESTIDVSVNLLCGGQALAKGWARRSNMVTEKTDYKFKEGVALDEMRGMTKVIYTHPTSGKVIQHGVVTIYAAGVADS